MQTQKVNYVPEVEEGARQEAVPMMMTAAPKNGAPLPPKRIKSQQQLTNLQPVQKEVAPPGHEITSPSSKILSSTVGVRKVSASRARQAAMAQDNRKQYIAVSAAKSPVKTMHQKSPLRQGSALHVLQQKKASGEAIYSDDELDVPPAFEIEEGVYDSDNSL